MRVRPATRTLPPRAWRSGRLVRVLRSTHTFVWTDGRYAPGFALTLSAKRMRLRPGVTMKLSRSWTRLGPVPWTMSSRPLARLPSVTAPHAVVEHILPEHPTPPTATHAWLPRSTKGILRQVGRPDLKKPQCLGGTGRGIVSWHVLPP